MAAVSTRVFEVAAAGLPTGRDGSPRRREARRKEVLARSLHPSCCACSGALPRRLLSSASEPHFCWLAPAGVWTSQAPSPWVVVAMTTMKRQTSRLRTTLRSGRSRSSSNPCRQRAGACPQQLAAATRSAAAPEPLTRQPWNELLLRKSSSYRPVHSMSLSQWR